MGLKLSFVIALGALSLGADNHHSDRLQILHLQGVNHAPDIIVSGKFGDKYSRIESTDLVFEVAARNFPPDHPVSEQPAKFWIDDTYVGEQELDQSTKVFRFTIPYRDMQSSKFANQRVSPIKICNDQLDKTAGEDRRRFLKEGKRVKHYPAYSVRVEQSWVVSEGRILLPSKMENKTFTAVKPEGANVVCKPLGAPTPVAKPPDPIASLKLRAEPMGQIKIGRQTCPANVRLYGTVEASIAKKFRVLMRGPKFLSPPRDLTFVKAGQQSVTETYKVRWDSGLDQLAGSSSKRTAMQQSLRFQINVADEAGRLLKTEKASIQLHCEVPSSPTRVRIPAG